MQSNLIFQSDRIAFNVEGAATAIGLSKSKLWQLIKDGKLSSVKVAGRRLIPAESLRALIAA